MDDFVVNKTVAQLETTQFVNKIGMQCNYQQKCIIDNFIHTVRKLKSYSVNVNNKIGYAEVNSYKTMMFSLVKWNIIWKPSCVNYLP
jgi:hypothetical protein